MTSSRTRVGIVGAGPAGLLLSHLLARAGIDSVVLDNRTREEIETTVRAGILEQGTVEVLSQSGASTRVLEDGHRHDGIELRFSGEGHRIDFRASCGRSVWLYPQHEVLRDLLAIRLREGQDIRFGVTAGAVDRASELPTIRATDRGWQCSSPSRPNLSLVRTGHAVSCGRRFVGRRRTDISGSIRSPGSGSSARLRRARRNSSTATRHTGLR